MSDGSQHADRIVIKAKIMASKPIVKGMLILVELVRKRLSQDLSIEAHIEAYPRLTPEDTRVCLAVRHVE